MIDLSEPGIARRGEWSAELSPVRFAMLRLLAKANGAVVTRTELLEAVYGRRARTPAALTTNISYLRKQLKGSGLTIHARTGFGYRLVVLA